MHTPEHVAKAHVVKHAHVPFVAAGVSSTCTRLSLDQCHWRVPDWCSMRLDHAIREHRRQSPSLEGQARAEMYISSGKHVGGFANSPDSKLHLLTHSPQKTSNKPSRPTDIQKIAMLHKAPMAIINTHISKGKRRTSIKKSRSQSR
jgi:hypothetical protein